MMNPSRPVVLASGSRYRRELLERLGLTFTVEAPNVDEAPRPGEPPAELVARLAESKARAVAAAHPDALVIGSDQVADADGIILGKPGSHQEAVLQLTRVSGRNVVFRTGVALVDARTGRCRARIVDVATRFRTLSAGAIEAYLRRELPYDCAGSVKAEGLGIALVESIASDDPTALIGLPLIALVDLLRAEGVDVLDDRPSVQK